MVVEWYGDTKSDNIIYHMLGNKGWFSLPPGKLT